MHTEVFIERSSTFIHVFFLSGGVGLTTVGSRAIWVARLSLADEVREGETCCGYERVLLDRGRVGHGCLLSVDGEREGRRVERRCI